MSLKLGSLFSGIGGFELVGSWYDIEPVWASEIEPAPIRITTKHFPAMKHYGDITKMHGNDVEPVDIITGGSPCQDLSVAGKKAGISATCVCCEKQYPVDKVGQTCPECGGDIISTRSGLFMDYIRIIREMRESANGEYPKIVVWENVPGALSSNNGDDFHAVLQEFAGLLGEKLPKFRPPQWQPSGQIMGDRGSLAWRILDAQYWGVPQRRRRIFLVVDLDGQRAGEILFKPDSLRRHTPKSRTPWKNFTEATKVSIGGSDREYEIYGLSAVNPNCMKSDNPRSGFYKTELSRTLDTNGNNPNCNQGGNVIVELGSTNEIKCYNPEDPQSARIYDENGIWHCLAANSNGGQARDGVLQSIQMRDHPYVVDVNSTDARYTEVNGVVGTITARMGTGGGNIPLVVQQDDTNDDIYCVGSFFEVAINKSCTLLSRDYKGAPLLCYAATEKDSSSVYCLDSFFCTSVDAACTLKATDFKSPQLVSYITEDSEDKSSGGIRYNMNDVDHVRDIVRRLTPTEAERLQGFPDEWTAGESDSARYKAIGNSVALPCVSYVMSGVVDALDQ